MMQLIGMIQLVGGSLNIARKEQKGVRLYIEEPESRMHPKRQAKMVSLLEMLKKDYGFTETTTENDGKETKN
jgi:predicted ATP-dependent endonuclease of OLD family